MKAMLFIVLVCSLGCSVLYPMETSTLERYESKDGITYCKELSTESHMLVTKFKRNVGGFKSGDFLGFVSNEDSDDRDYEIEQSKCEELYTQFEREYMPTRKKTAKKLSSN